MPQLLRLCLSVQRCPAAVVVKTNSDGAASVLIPAGRSDVQCMHPWPDFFPSHLLEFYPSFVSFYVLCGFLSRYVIVVCGSAQGLGGA